MPQDCVPAPCLPQLPVSASSSAIERSIRSPWYDLPVFQPAMIFVRLDATLRASVRIVSGFTPEISDAASGA